MFDRVLHASKCILLYSLRKETIYLIKLSDSINSSVNNTIKESCHYPLIEKKSFLINLFSFFVCFGFVYVYIYIYIYIYIFVRIYVCLTILYSGVKLQNGISTHNRNVIGSNRVKGNEELL